MRDRQMVITRFPEFWEVSTYWLAGETSWKHMTTVRVRAIRNLLACIERVADRPEFIVRIKCGIATLLALEGR